MIHNTPLIQTKVICMYMRICTAYFFYRLCRGFCYYNVPGSPKIVLYLVLPIYMCVCVSVYTHTHTHTHIYGYACFDHFIVLLYVTDCLE